VGRSGEARIYYCASSIFQRTKKKNTCSFLTDLSTPGTWWTVCSLKEVVGSLLSGFFHLIKHIYDLSFNTCPVSNTMNMRQKILTRKKWLSGKSGHFSFYWIQTCVFMCVHSATHIHNLLWFPFTNILWTCFNLSTWLYSIYSFRCFKLHFTNDLCMQILTIFSKYKLIIL
jgi:hypothetical protein